MKWRAESFSSLWRAHEKVQREARSGKKFICIHSRTGGRHVMNTETLLSRAHTFRNKSSPSQIECLEMSIGANRTRGRRDTLDDGEVYRWACYCVAICELFNWIGTVRFNNGFKALFTVNEPLESSFISPCSATPPKTVKEDVTLNSPDSNLFASIDETYHATNSFIVEPSDEVLFVIPVQPHLQN